jgi:hypothetical protein
MEEHKTDSTNSPEVTHWALFGMGVLVVIGFCGVRVGAKAFYQIVNVGCVACL